MEKDRIIEEGNLYEHFTFEADAGQKPLRVDKFLINRIENLSRNKIQMAAKSGFIFVNEISVKPNYKIKPKDIVKVTLPHPPFENLLKSEKIRNDNFCSVTRDILDRSKFKCICLSFNEITTPFSVNAQLLFCSTV